ncbi:MAG TPA: XdhC/CoxI family protein [Tenuifilaceae bacterium]|nr:XdhC/CoxI family protein [Tenuifilaceae bacterium]
MKDFLFQLSELKSQNRIFTLCIIVGAKGSTPRKEGAKMLVFDDGTIFGTIGGGAIELQVIADALEVLKSGKLVKKMYRLEEDVQMHCGGSLEIYMEPFHKALNLYIFGAGHVGREVGRFAADLDFKVVYVDNREGIYHEFPCDYARCITNDYYKAIEEIEFTPRDFAVITTPNHEFDEQIMLRMAGKGLTYVGMIGSKRKVAEARKRLLAQGVIGEEELNRVDMPIGIPFNSQTPREIAISIVAKLIDVKNTQGL